MDRNQKFLKRLSDKEFTAVEKILLQILNRDTTDLDIKKLSGYRDIYRAQYGNVRIIFLDTGKNIEVLEMSRRSEQTYRNF